MGYAWRRARHNEDTPKSWTKVRYRIGHIRPFGKSNVTLQHYAHVIGDAERIASEKFSQRLGKNIAQLESDSELQSTSAVKTA